MKTSELLRIARDKYLARCQSEIPKYKRIQVFNAATIAATEIGTVEAQIAAIRVKDDIESLLYPHTHVAAWLFANGHASFSELYAKDGPHQNIYDYSHRWINHLIQQYEAKGD